MAYYECVGKTQKDIDNAYNEGVAVGKKSPFTVNVSASSSNPGSDRCNTTISNLESYTKLTATIQSTGYSGYKSYNINSSGTTLASGKDSGFHTIDISSYSSISFYSTSTNGRGHSATLTFS